MVNATIDNEPVSIVLDDGQSTTVPSNETWKVSIYLGARQTQMNIDGIGQFSSFASNKTSNVSFESVTLTGGQKILNISGFETGPSVIFITGFVVNS